jgi:hypothetical protein
LCALILTKLHSFQLRFISSEQVVKSVIELDLAHLTPATQAHEGEEVSAMT